MQIKPKKKQQPIRIPISNNKVEKVSLEFLIQALESTIVRSIGRVCLTCAHTPRHIVSFNVYNRFLKQNPIVIHVTSFLNKK
jgi:hypothetical protein